MSHGVNVMDNCVCAVAHAQEQASFWCGVMECPSVRISEDWSDKIHLPSYGRHGAARIAAKLGHLQDHLEGTDNHGEYYAYMMAILFFWRES